MGKRMYESLIAKRESIDLVKNIKMYYNVLN